MLLWRHHPVGQYDIEAMVKERKAGLLPDGIAGRIYQRRRTACLLIVSPSDFDERRRVGADEDVAASDGGEKGGIFLLAVDFVGAPARYEHRGAGFGFVGDVQGGGVGIAESAEEILYIFHGSEGVGLGLIPQLMVFVMPFALMNNYLLNIMGIDEPVFANYPFGGTTSHADEYFGVP